jgi:ribonuclease HII
MPHLLLETEHGRLRGVIIAGTDEAGRGPLAGPVVAAAVIIAHDLAADLHDSIRDSKKLTAQQRDDLFPRICETCAHAIAECSVEEIDRLNILHASLLAMRRAVEALARQVDLVLVDGNKTPPLNGIKALPVIGGDDISLSIAAASILAKVTRDRQMHELHEAFPHYGWAQNRGYPTAFHRAALEKHGPTPHHRQSFTPVKKFFAAG